METSEIFKINLKRLRAAHWTQGTFAPRVNLSERGYQKYETGESRPTPEILDRFAAALGIEPWELIVTGKKPKKKTSFNDAALFLSAYADLSPKLQKIVWAIVFEDETLYTDDMKRALELPG